MPRTFVLFLAFTLVLCAGSQGCAKKEVDNPEDQPKGTFGRRTSGGVDKGREPIKAPLDGIVKGRIVFQGEKPANAIIVAMTTHSDKAGCLAGSDSEKMDQKWMIGKDNGVANVVVSIKAPPGKFFELRDEDKKRTDTVFMDQPHCAFVPHVAAAFPAYFDGKKFEPTGQQFVIKNSAGFNHNTNLAGDPLKTGTLNQMVPPKGNLAIKLIPETKPISIKCDIHPWMYARIWAFDHPFFARTDADGYFEIKNVPTGIEVSVVAWHEAQDYFYNGKEGVKHKFTPGENKLQDIPISAK